LDPEYDWPQLAFTEDGIVVEGQDAQAPSRVSGAISEPSRDRALANSIRQLDSALEATSNPEEVKLLREARSLIKAVVVQASVPLNPVDQGDPDDDFPF